VSPTSNVPVRRSLIGHRAVDDSTVTGHAFSSILGSATRELQGVAVAIGAAVDDSTGFACRGNLAGGLVDQHTVFYGASVTKQFVGLAAASADVDGRLDVDDPITQWVPELPGSLTAIRLDHLIHHTSDLPDVADPAVGAPASNAEVVQRFQHADPEGMSPGVRFAYNNAGYVLLAEALAHCQHQSLDEIISSEFLGPLGMTDTRLGGPAVQLTGRPDPPGTVGDGGLWTSASDLIRWLQACNRSVFGTEVHQLAESTTTLVDGSPLDYAWGIRVTEASRGRIISHGGSWDRWLAKTVRIPERHVAVAVLSVGATESQVSQTGTDLAVAIASDRTPVERRS
jgi:CubicO group peptidase (beta-lactamase class C family)